MTFAHKFKGPPGQKLPKERGTPREKRYFAWLHKLGTCCLTGRPDIELAHTGGLSEGKGTSRKSRLNTILPLSRVLHHFEERQREEFWTAAGFPFRTRFDWSERLMDLFEKDDTLGASALFADMRDQADREYLRNILVRHQ